MKARGKSAGAAATGEEKKFVVRGYSMWFLLRAGDVIHVRRPADPAVCRRGDILLLFDSGGVQYIVHRLLSLARAGAGWRFRTRGDWSADWDDERWIPVGKVVAFERGGVLIPWEGPGTAAVNAVIYAFSRALHALQSPYGILRRVVWGPFWSWSTGRFGPTRAVFRLVSVWMEPAAQRLEHAAAAAAASVVSAVLAVHAARRASRTKAP